MFSLLLSQLWPYVAGAAGLIAGFFFVRLSGKAAGKQEVRQEINEAESAARKEARNVELETDAMDDGSVRDAATRWVRGTKR